MAADGKIIYEVIADNSRLDGDLKNTEAKIKSSSNGMASLIGKAFAGATIASAAKAIWDLGTSFEDGMAKVSTLVNTAEVDMSKMSKDILGLSNQYGIAADEYAQAAYNAISANSALANDSEGMMLVLEKSTKLAKGGFTDIDTAISATLKTLNSYGYGVEETDRIQRILMQTQNNGITTVGELGSVLSNVTPTAAAMGVQFEQVGAGIATLTAAGTPAAQATTQLNSLFAELGKSGTKAQLALVGAADGTQYAGMSFQDMMAAGVPLNEVLGLLEISAQENGLTMLDMFSSIEAGKAALSMTGSGAEAFTNNLAAMSTETDVVGEAFDKVSGTSSEKLSKAFNSLKTFAITLFTALEPIISVVLELAGTIINTISTALEPIIEIINEIVNVVMPPLKAIFEVVSKSIGEQLNNVISYIKNMFEVGKTIFNGLIDFIAGVFTGNWSRAWEGVKNVFKGIIEGIANIFKAPINWIIDGINTFIDGINSIQIPDWVPVVGGMGFNIRPIPRLRVGMDYVPSDDFPAFLHKGEAVLTAAEAETWRSGMYNGINSGSNQTQATSLDIDYEKLADAVTKRPIIIEGRDMERTVSKIQARTYESRERSGGLGII